MAVFVIERRFAEALNPTAEGAKEINLINDEEGVDGPAEDVLPL